MGQMQSTTLSNESLLLRGERVVDNDVCCLKYDFREFIYVEINKLVLCHHLVTAANLCYKG